MEPEKIEILILKLIKDSNDFSGYYDDLKNELKKEISEEDFGYAIESLIREGFVIGFKKIAILGTEYPSYISEHPRLTMSGREYLESTSILGKTKSIMKEIKEIIPKL